MQAKSNAFSFPGEPEDILYESHSSQKDTENCWTGKQNWKRRCPLEEHVEEGDLFSSLLIYSISPSNVEFMSLKELFFSHLLFSH